MTKQTKPPGSCALAPRRLCLIGKRIKMWVLGSVVVIQGALFVAPSVLAKDGKVVHVVRFTDYEVGPVEDWLRRKGFQFKLDARRREKIDLNVGEKGLVLEAKRRAFGVTPNESVNLTEFTYVEIDWGV